MICYVIEIFFHYFTVFLLDLFTNDHSCAWLGIDPYLEVDPPKMEQDLAYF